ncbi:hypothetical protein D3C71_1957170 [compost metagenome]
MASDMLSFCQPSTNRFGRHMRPAIGAGPALVDSATTPDSLMRRSSAISTFEKPSPTITSTLSFSMNFCTICAPTSGLS